MKYRFSESSLKKLWTCQGALQRLMFKALESSPCDISIICGFRGEKEQQEAFKKGRSKLKFPMSNHNIFPSKAIDVIPFPVNWKDKEKFKELGSHIKKIAKELDIEIIWGGDWSLGDFPHFELR